MANYSMTNRVSKLYKHSSSALPSKNKNLLVYTPITKQEDGFALEQNILEIFVTELNGEFLIPE